MNKKIFTLIGFLFLIGTLAAGVLLVFQKQNLNKEAAPATVLSISPESQNKIPGEELLLNVNLNTGNNKVLGFDVQLNFDPDIFEVTSLNQGDAIDGFTVIKNETDNIKGSVLLSVFNLDKTQFLQGSELKIVNINAKVKNTASQGKYSFSFDPTTAIAALMEKYNVLSASIPGYIKVGSGATSAPTPGEPNSCNGTCGSNYNCKSGLFCHDGYCRNPQCANDSSCGCLQTATPTSNPSGSTTLSTKPPSPKPTPKPSSEDDEIVYYNFGSNNPTKSPSPSPSNLDLPLNPVNIEPDSTQKIFDPKSIAITALAALALLYGVFLLIKTLRSSK